MALRRKTKPPKISQNMVQYFVRFVVSFINVSLVDKRQSEIQSFNSDHYREVRDVNQRMLESSCVPPRGS